MKFFKHHGIKIVVSILVLLCAFGNGNLFAQPCGQVTVPQPLKTDPQYVQVASFYAVGTQNYRAVPDTAHAGQLKWMFVEPAASLYDCDGNVVVLHKKGPVWLCVKDSSSVTGKVVAKAPSKVPSQNIDWLLLSGSPHGVTGLLSNIVSIQRLDTRGGVSPTIAPTPAMKDCIVKVPYSALYVFYKNR